MISEQVTLISRTPAGVDRYNKPVLVDSSTVVEVLAFAPGETSQSITVGQTTTTSTGTLYAPPGLTVNPEDEFIVRGLRYQVDGTKAVWQTSNRYPGDVIKLTRTVLTHG